ncbi:hypothetical protein PR048_012045 [Dryococelus australis]|uniref:Uncharacterized protein n=1 Tax=Dryococelus australis TaxID=614101 RepID=A0ABQ9HN83_9NEOP|nr:hypothetical protein PR048_012045 [Dryococelus australis]
MPTFQILDNGPKQRSGDSLVALNIEVLRADDLEERSDTAGKYTRFTWVEDEEYDHNTTERDPTSDETLVVRVNVARATVAERLACSPSTKVIRAQYPAGSLRIFAIVPDDAVGWRIFSGISRFPRPFISALPQSPSSALDTSIHVFADDTGVACPLSPLKITAPSPTGLRVSEEVEAAPNSEVSRADEDPREDPLTNSIVRHYSHLRKPGERANRSATVAPLASVCVTKLIPLVHVYNYGTKTGELLGSSEVNCGAAAAERLACSPPTKRNRFNPRPGHSRIFMFGNLVPDDVAGRRVYSGISRFPPPPALYIPALLHTRLTPST